MKIVLATKNRHKVEEIIPYLKDLSVEILSLENFSGIELKEDHQTLRENALQKARITALQTKNWALGDDTGLFVAALDGAPGIFSSRYAGEQASYEENVAKLLNDLRDVAEGERGAYFSCLLALVHPDGREVVVEGRLEGEIASEPQGENGFGYDPIFFLPDRGLTLAQLSLEEKNRISHRGRALFKMRGVIEGLVKMENRK